MATAPTTALNDTTQSDLPALLGSWRRHLAAQRMSPATLDTYSASVRGLDRFLVEQAMTQVAAQIGREHVEAFITDLLERWKPATAHNRYRACRSFFGWLVDEGEVRENPMARMKPPRLPEETAPVLREADFRRLLEVCERDKTLSGRRDAAILQILIDTGARRGEVLGLTLEDVNLDEGLLRVIGKGSRTRHVPIGAQTVRSIDRYLRARVKHPMASSPSLWLSRKGVLHESGLAELSPRPRARGWPDDTAASPRFPPRLCPRHVGSGDAGDGPDGGRGLEESGHGRALRRVHAGRARHRRRSRAQSSRSPRRAQVDVRGPHCDKLRELRL